MKSSRLIMSAFVALTLLGSGFASEAYSRPGCDPSAFNDGCTFSGPCDTKGFHPGRHMMRGLSAEQQAKYTAVVDAYRPRMEPLREAMFLKFHELNALENAQKPDVQAVRAAAAELYRLRGQMLSLHQEMEDRIAKEVGMPANRPCVRDKAPKEAPESM